MSILLQNPKSDQLNAALLPSNDPKHPATYVLPQLQWLNSEDASSPPLGYACASGREAEDLLEACCSPKPKGTVQLNP